VGYRVSVIFWWDYYSRVGTVLSSRSTAHTHKIISRSDGTKVICDLEKATKGLY
jgi:hypothetical protein